MSFVKLSKAKILLAPTALILVACGKASFDPSKPMSSNEVSAITGTLKVSANNVADGITAALITIEVKNMSGAPVPGVSLSLSVSGSDNVIVPCTKTDANGLSRCKVYSTRAERKTITVIGSMIQSVAGALSLNLTAETLFMAPNPMRSAFGVVSSGDVQALPSGQKIIASSGIVETTTAQWSVTGKMQAHTSILGSIISDK